MSLHCSWGPRGPRFNNNRCKQNTKWKSWIPSKERHQKNVIFGGLNSPNISNLYTVSEDWAHSYFWNSLISASFMPFQMNILSYCPVRGCLCLGIAKTWGYEVTSGASSIRKKPSQKNIHSSPLVGGECQSGGKYICRFMSTKIHQDSPRGAQTQPQHWKATPSVQPWPWGRRHPPSRGPRAAA